MKDLLIITITTVVVSIVWYFVDTNKIIEEKVITKQILEISTPFSGKIDVGYLNGLEEPAL